MSDSTVDSSIEARAWVLDGATVIEAARAGAASEFLVRFADRWIRCEGLEPALQVAWEMARAKAYLPAQWTALEARLRHELHCHRQELLRLPFGQWWPDRPPLHPASPHPDPDPEGLAA